MASGSHQAVAQRGGEGGAGWARLDIKADRPVMARAARERAMATGGVVAASQGDGRWRRRSVGARRRRRNEEGAPP